MRPAPARLSDLTHYDEKHESLRRRLVLWLGMASVVLVAALAWGSYTWVQRSLRQQVTVQLTDAAQRSAALVDRMLTERSRSVRVLGAAPVVIDAASQGAAHHLADRRRPVRDLSVGPVAVHDRQQLARRRNGPLNELAALLLDGL